MKELWDKYRNKGNTKREFTEDPRNVSLLNKDQLEISPEIIQQTVTAWLNGTTPKSEGSSKTQPEQLQTTDRVLSAGLKEEIISESDVQVWREAAGLDKSQQLDWRTVVQIDSWRAQQLERMASRVYGFRSVMVCQMSSLVLGDLLTGRLSPKKWEDLYEAGIAPVVEHGQAPLLNGRVVFISNDPSNKLVRTEINSITDLQTELAYADLSVVRGVLDLLSQHIPAIGSAVRSHIPNGKRTVGTTMTKVDTSFVSSKRAA